MAGLTDAERAAWDADGVFVVRDLFPAPQLAALQSEASRLISAELAMSRLAHSRGSNAAPASVRSMVSRTAGHSSSEQEDEMEMELEKEMIAMELVIDKLHGGTWHARQNEGQSRN